MKKALLLLTMVFVAYLTKAQYMVAFSDYDGINGIYTESGTENNHPKYTKGSSQIYYYDCTVKWVLESSGINCNAYTTYDDGQTPPTKNWVKGGKSLAFVGEIAVAKLNSLAIDSYYIVESEINDGTFSDSINIILYAFENSFTGAVSEDMVAAGKVDVNNVPAGLSAKVIRKSDSTATLFLTGTATDHSAENNISNLEITFNNNAFSNNNITNLASTSFTNINVWFQKQYIVSNSDNNDINGSYHLIGARHKKPLYKKGDYILFYKGCNWGIQWAIRDQTETSDECPEHQTSAKGNDVPHQGWSDDVSVFSYNSLVFSSSSLLESSSDDGSITDSINIIYPHPITNNSFSGTNGDDFITDGKITIENTPIGLTAQAIRISDTLITIKFTGNATAHEYKNSIDNISITVNNNSFSDNNTSDISNLNHTAIIYFMRTIQVTQAENTTAVNGTYRSCGLANGKLAYKHENGTYFLGYRNYQHSKWVIINNGTDSDKEGIKRITNTLSICPVYSSCLDVEDFPRTAWSSNRGGGYTGNIGDQIEVQLHNSFVYSTKNIAEGNANDGSITDTIAITYWFPTNSNKFTGNNGDDFIALGHLSVSNLPQGLTASAERINDTTLVVRFSGNATNHEFSDNTQDLNFEINNSALAKANAADITDYSKDINLVFQKKYYILGSDNEYDTTYVSKGIFNGKPYFCNDNAILGYRGRGYKWVLLNHVTDPTFLESKLETYDRTKTDGELPPFNGYEYNRIEVYPYNSLVYCSNDFKESTSNKGEIDNSEPLIIHYIPNQGAKLSGSNGDDFVADGKITVQNLPGGYRVIAERISDDSLSVTISGTSNTNTINNLSFTFNNAAFVNSSKNEVFLSTKTDLSIKMHSEFYIASSGGDFTSITEAMASGLVNDGDVLNLAAETFTESNIEIKKAITIKGVNPRKTIIQAALTPRTADGRIFYINTSYQSVYIQNLTLQNGFISYNGIGGCIYSENTHLYIDNCYIKDNEIDNSTQFYQHYSGGAIRARYSKLVITNTTFENNKMNYTGNGYSSNFGGGAISSYAMRSGSKITNCTFANNSAPSNTGGAIYSLDGSSNFFVMYSTFYKNTSAENNNAYKTNGSNNLMYNNIFVNNNISGSQPFYCLFDTLSLANTAGIDASNILDVDAKVSALDWNGGSTPTCAIGSVSPAIDASNNTNAPATDQRRVAIANSHRDIGAYEYNSTIQMASNVTELDFGTVSINKTKELYLTISGINLSNDVVLTAPANCELSLYSGKNFSGSSSLTIAPLSGKINDTVIYIKYTQADNSSYNEILTIESTGSTPINISINAQPNSAPVFNTISSNLNVDENSTVGTSLLTLSATDADAHNLTYATSSDIIAVNALNGEVSISNASYFDAEINSSIEFDVIVSDGFYNNHEKVTIAINNLNDNAPVFETIAGNLNIDENKTAGTELLTVSATDADGSLNTLAYSTTETKVAVDASTGKVTIADVAYFDAETNTDISFDVRVTDGTFENTETVTVAINNINDNAPVFATLDNNLSIDENSAKGATIVTLSATDADGDDVTFSTTDKKIAVNTTTGEVNITDSAAFDNETNTTITFDIIANDGVNSSTQTVTIAVNNLNDNTPVFSAIATDLSVDENSVKGTTLVTLSATDADGELNDLVYTSNNKNIIIDASSGKVILADTKLDYETVTSFSFDVKVSDGTNSDTETVSIAINNLNDNAPVIAAIADTLSINENSTIGSELLTLSATDADGSLTALTFSTNEEKVSVDAKTGKVTIADSAYFDAESNDSILFSVIVSDGINKDSASVKIAINNINDNAPFLAAIATGLNVDENSTAGTELLTLSATDADGDTLTFSTTETKVVVDASSGKVTIAEGSVFDAETEKEFSFDVKVTDGIASDNKTVSITINNLNDNAPVFEKDSFEINLIDTEINNQAILELKATDADELEALTYSISDGFNVFELSENGLLKIANINNIDKTKDKAEFEMIIQVSDGELTDNANVFVSIDITTGLVTVYKSMQVNLFPNPAQNQLTIKIPEFNEIATLEIFTTNGQKVHDIDVYNASSSINISDLTNGIYLVKIQSGNKVAMKKLVKE